MARLASVSIAMISRASGADRHRVQVARAHARASHSSSMLRPYRSTRSSQASEPSTRGPSTSTIRWKSPPTQTSRNALTPSRISANGDPALRGQLLVDEPPGNVRGRLGHDRAEQVGLVAEVVVQGAAGDPGLGDDLLGAGAVEALGREQPACRREQRLPGVGGVLGAPGAGPGG